MQISTGTLETAAGTITVKDFTYTDNMRYAALYLLFAYFWTSEFIVAMGQVIKTRQRYSHEILAPDRLANEAHDFPFQTISRNYQHTRHKLP